MIRQMHRILDNGKHTIRPKRGFGNSGNLLRNRQVLEEGAAALRRQKGSVPLPLPTGEGALYKAAMHVAEKWKSDKPFRKKVILAAIIVALAAGEVHACSTYAQNYYEKVQMQEAARAERRRYILKQLAEMEERIDRLVEKRADALEQQVEQQEETIKKVIEGQQRDRENFRIIRRELRLIQEHMVRQGHTFDGGLVEEEPIVRCEDGGECK
ncbi:hypothetical protein JW721_00280 [Candidatus Micrarchaeota archaeon]|nr:hypothetical protein [Candidatus Micrarchaeota archaeon]